MAVHDILMGASGTPVYVEDVFSTYLYTGSGASRSITNGINLSTYGGLVWIKDRGNATNHNLFDTENGATNSIHSNTASNTTDAASLTSFNSNGFSLGTGNTNANQVNTNNATFASWTFRQQSKFFDIVTYTGNGTNRTIAHKLGSTPGCIMIKCVQTGFDWAVYHSDVGASASIKLNGLAASSTFATFWNNTAPTSSVFSLGTDNTVNNNGSTYVAYIFASNAGGFGADGSQSVITCGSYTGNGSASGPSVNLGWEPQFVLVRAVSGNDWVLHDTLRGTSVNTSVYATLNSTAADTALNPAIIPIATGFKVATTNSKYNSNNGTYIYIAIRRPMKTPTAGTDVFVPSLRTGTGTTAGSSTALGSPVDLAIIKARSGSNSWVWQDRLRGANYTLGSDLTTAEATISNFGFDSSTGFSFGSSSVNTNGVNFVDYLFRRAPGFFDQVCYTGTGANTTITHGLGVAPELMIIKDRSVSTNWAVYAAPIGNTKYLQLNGTVAPTTLSTVWNNTSPTSSVFSLGTNSIVNSNGDNYVAYLFASIAGVSKIGTYTGNGSTQTINCGFSNGARFVLIKRYDVSDWWDVFDTARGIVAASDPYLQMHSNANETTNEDVLDPASSGFIVNSGTSAGLNVNNGTYLYLAIA